MSVNGSVQSGTYGITIEVPEKLIEELLFKGKKPPVVLSRIIQRMTSEIEIEKIIDYAEDRASPFVTIGNVRKEKPIIRKISLISSEWTSHLFDEYMKKLLIQAEMKASVADLISMLVGYYDTSSRPTSEELRQARGFVTGEKWYEELRTSKARLTIAAKHMGLPSFFLRAYGSGMERRHPMNEVVYKFLYQWFSNNQDIVVRFRKKPTPRFAG